MSASPLSSVLGFNLSSVIWYKPLNENWNDKPHSFEREVADIKLILYAILRLHDRDKKKVRITVNDVALEYQRLADESNIGGLSTSQVTDKIRELVMLGFLKCKYVRKGSCRIKYIHIYQPDEIPKYISVLQEELGKVRFEDITK